MLNTKFEIEEKMGSIEKPRISKATLDKKAESHFFTELKRRFEWLEEQNANLIEENKKLKGIIARLYEAEPKELDDKWANSKTRMFVQIAIALMDG